MEWFQIKAVQSGSVFVYLAWFKLPDQIWMKSILFSNEILLIDPQKKVFMDLNLPNKPFSEAVYIISFNVNSEILA